MLERSRRLVAAEDRVALELARLPAGWLVERYVLAGVRRLPFLVVGCSGVFAICATDGAWTMRDLQVMATVAYEVHRRLPRYAGGVHAAVCLAFDATAPRAWFGGQHHRGHGTWVLGVDWLLGWMLAAGAPDQWRNDDLRRMDEAAGPFWERRSTARLPATQRFG